MKQKVLFVDDQEEIIELIKLRLKDEEYDKYFANSAQQALEIIKAQDIDVLITDMVMPEMGGLELLEIVKDDYPQIVRIVLSGFSQVPSIISAINDGNIYRYITKPWKVDNNAKKIIKDALDYAKFLKFKEATCVTDNYVSLEKVKELVEKLNLEYSVVEKEQSTDDCQLKITLNKSYDLLIDDL